MSNISQVQSLLISSYSIENGYVRYLLVINAVTRFMHPLTLKDSIPFFKKWTRYAELLELHQKLTGHSSSVPKFPPKKLIGNKNPQFIESRIQALNDYFREIVTDPSLRSCEPLMKFVSPTDTIDIGLIGPSNSLNFLKSLLGEENSYEKLPVDLIAKQKLFRIQSIRLVEYIKNDDWAIIPSSSQGFVICFDHDFAFADSLIEEISPIAPCILFNLAFTNEESVFVALSTLLFNL